MDMKIKIRFHNKLQWKFLLNTYFCVPIGLKQVEGVAYPSNRILLIFKQLCILHGDFLNLILLGSLSRSSYQPGALDVIFYPCFTDRKTELCACAPVGTITTFYLFCMLGLHEKCSLNGKSMAEKVWKPLTYTMLYINT